MKKQVCLVLLITICCIARAQNVGIGTTTPNASAQLDISSTTKGILVPRMSTVQRNAIASPARGLLVFDTTTNSFWFYNGTAWTNLSAASGSGWSLTGNAGTTGGNFIGTTDNVPLRFKVYNQIAGIIDSTSYNTAIGYRTLTAATAPNNSAFGYKALEFTSTGIQNTGAGYGALNANITGNNNTALGNAALETNISGHENTSTGSAALYSNTTGTDNTAMGFAALHWNNSGGNNTAVGAYSLYYNGNGANTAADEGTKNTAVGSQALYNNTKGLHNTAVGYSAMSANTTGFFNAALGYGSLSANTIGRDNTAMGLASLNVNTTGSYNTAFGSRADVSSGNLTNATAIGAGAIVDGSNTIKLGNDQVTLVKTSGDMVVRGGKGIVRSYDGNQLVIVKTFVDVNVVHSPGYYSTYNFSFPVPVRDASVFIGQLTNTIINTGWKYATFSVIDVDPSTGSGSIQVTNTTAFSIVVTARIVVIGIGSTE